MRRAASSVQETLFDQSVARRPMLPVIGEQKDISYFGSRARGILNGPETTGMGFWSINPYVGCAFGCAYCYARYAHRYTLERSATSNPAHGGLQEAREALPPWLAFERRIFVKENAADVLRETLRGGSPKLEGLLHDESLVIGTATDPYQPAERRYKVTRSVLEVLAEHPGLRITIITKSPLVTRDIDVLRRISRHSSIGIHVSLITMDRELARRLEPRAPTPDSRVRAIARLRESGIHVAVNLMPVLPGITDGPLQIEEVVRAVVGAKANALNACALRLQSAARERYLPFIESEFPSLAPRYRSTYARNANVGERYQEGLRRVIGRICAKHGLSFGRYDRGPELERPASPSAEVMEQLVLGLG